VSTTDPADAIARVLRVPDSCRNFTVDKSALARQYGIDEALLSQLEDLGLPSRNRRFDRLDLDNIGLALRLPCARNTAMRGWSRSLAERSTRPLAEELVVRAWCPSPGHLGKCGFALAPELVDALVTQGPQQGSGMWFRLRAQLTTSTWIFGPPFTDLFEQVLPLQFHLIPPPLAKDLGFLAGTGLADCELATRFLVRQADALGLPVRAASGIFIARPYPVEHYWIECRGADGQWLAADPFLLMALRRWGIIEGPDWTPDWSLQSVLWCTATTFGKIVTHAGHDTRYLITTGMRRGSH
jgi:hypothetical protein